MDRNWFITWRTYGTWLPGEDGFVGYYRASNGTCRIDKIPGELLTGPIPALERYARRAMSGRPIILTLRQAEALMAQFHETAAHRLWYLDAVAVMTNHVHLVFAVPGDPDPSELLKSWKSYASRALNRLGPRLTLLDGSRMAVRNNDWWMRRTGLERSGMCAIKRGLWWSG